MGTTVARPIVKDEVLLVEDDPEVGRPVTRAVVDEGFEPLRRGERMKVMVDVGA